MSNQPDYSDPWRGWGMFTSRRGAKGRKRGAIARRQRARFLRVETLESRELLAAIAKFDFDAAANEAGPTGWTHYYPGINGTDQVVDTTSQIGLRLMAGSPNGFTANYAASTVPTDAVNATIKNGIDSGLGSGVLVFAFTGLDPAKSYEVWVLGGNVSGASFSQQVSVQGGLGGATFTQSIASLNLAVNGSVGSNANAITEFAPAFVQTPYFDGDLSTNAISLTVDAGSGRARIAGAVIREFVLPSTATLPTSGGPFTLSMQSGNRVLKNSSGAVVTTLANTGAITINGTDAVSDRLNVDFTGGNPLAGGVTFNGGEQAGDDDRLSLSGYSLSTADGVADVTVTHTGPESGNVTLAGLGTINFTQIEPLVLTGTAADLVVTLPPGPNLDATLGDDGVAPIDGTNNANTSAIYDSTSPYSFEYTEFTNPTNSLTINRGSASDKLTVNSLAAAGFNAGLTIGAAGSEFGSVAFLGPITLTGNKSLAVTTSKGISLVPSAIISTGSGSISLSANQQATPGTGDFFGIDVNGGTIKSVSGDISLAGRGGTGITPQVGVYLREAALVGDTTTGNVTINGRGGNTPSGSAGGNVGVFLENGSMVQTNGGNIVVNGTGGSDAGNQGLSSGVHVDQSAIQAAGAGTLTMTGIGAGPGSFGIHVAIGAEALKTGSGKMTLTGTGEAGVFINGAVVTASADIQITGTASVGGEFGIRQEGSINTIGSGNVRMIADSIETQGGVGVETRTVSIVPKTAGRPIKFNETDDPASLTLSNSEQSVITAGILNIGDATSGPISVVSDIARVAATAVNLTSGGAISFTTGSLDSHDGNVTLSPGNTAPGGAASFARSGTDLTVGAGRLRFGSGADLAFNIGGTTADTGYQRLNVIGNVDLTGTDLVVSGSYTPLANDTFAIVKYTGTRTGSFSNGTVKLNGKTLGVAYDDANKQVLLAVLPPGSLSAALDATGNLTVTDTDAIGKNNNLTVSASGGNLIITDAVERFGSFPAGGTLSNGDTTLTIPLASVSGSLTINGAGGNDSLTLDLTAGNPFPTGGISYSGGNPTTGPGDKLAIAGGNQGTVTYNYTNAHDGGIVMSNFGTVSYTGLEPIANSGTASDVVFNLPAGPNTVTLGDDGISGNGLSRLSGGTFETTDFANPSGTVTINRGNAADSLSVNSLPDFTAGIKIGSTANPLNAVSFAGAVTLGSGKFLEVSSSSVNASSAAAISVVGGGSVKVTADDMAIDLAATISATGGSVSISPLTANRAIDLGTETSGKLSLTDGELDRVSADAINIASGTGGGLTISAPVDRATGSTTAITLATDGSSSITFNDSGSLDAKNGDVTLLINASGSGAIVSGGAATDVSGANLSLIAGSGGIGASGNPLVIAATKLNSKTGGNSNQYLSASGMTTIDATGLSAGTGTIEFDGGTFALGGSDRVSDSSKLNVNGATFDISALNETVGGITLTSGSITGTSGVLTSANTIQTQSGSISAILGGNVGLTQSATGMTTLSGVNTYSGDTTISGGTLKLGAANVIPDGSGKGNVVFNPASGTATLDLGGFSEAVNGLSSSGAGSSVVDNSVAGGPFTLTVGGNNAASVFNGVIQNTAGAVTVTKAGTGQLTLGGANTYSGGTSVLQGTLKTAGSGVLPGAGNVSIQSGATLSLGGSQTIGALTSIDSLGGDTITNTAAATLTITGSGSFYGAITNGGGGTATSLVVDAAGKTVDLFGNNTYTGTTTVTAGTLLVDGFGGTNLTSNVSVANGATLGGSGKIAGANSVTVDSGGHLAPRVLNSGNVSLASGANFDVKLNGTSLGSGYTQQNVAGTVSLAGATLNVSLGFTPSVGNTFTIILNDGTADAVNGTFNGLPEGAVLSVTTGSFSAALQISYVGGDGNDVVLKTLSTTNPVLDGTAGDDAWLVKRNATSGNTDISLNGTLLWSATGLSGITINGQNGNDSLTVDLSAGNAIPSAGITFNGGESTGDDDRLKITGYNLPTADGVADVTVAHTGPEAGSVVLAGLGTVFFTQIEPLALVGTAADLVITLPAGPNPDATLGDDGVAALGDATNDANTSAIYDSTSPRSFEYTEFTNPTNALTINRGSATDNLTVLDLVAAGMNAGLTIGAAAAEFNAVTFNGPITLATNSSLSANALSTISLPAAAILAVSGTGGISLTTARNITQAAGSTITTVNGNVSLSANRQGTPTAANFAGLVIGGSITTSGTGGISLSGRGGNAASVNNLYGVWINSGQVRSTGTGATAGTITINGTGGTGTVSSLANVGVEMDNATTAISSVDGNISITGNATTTISTFQDGIRQTGTPRIDITGSGTLTLTGTPGLTTGGTNGVGLRLAGPMDVTGSQTTFVSNRMALNTTDFSLNAHGNTVILRPNTNNTPIDVGSLTDTNATVTLELSDQELDKITASVLQIGDANSGTISITNAISRPSLTNVNLVSGGSINFVTAASSGQIMTSNGNVTLTPGGTGSVGVASTSMDVNMGNTGTVGTLSFANGSDLAIVINGQIQGSDYHQLTLSGNVNLANVDLKLSGTYKPQVGDRFTIVNNTLGSGVTSGTFNGLPEGTVFNPAAGNLNADLQITYKGVGGGGNDVVLTAINLAPTLNAISDPATILEGAGLQTINLSGITAGGTQAQTLTVTATSDNPTLIASPISVNYTSPGSTGSLSYTPEPGQFGTAVITVTVKDNGGVFGSQDQDTVVRTFVVRVAEVNDAPTGVDDTLAAIAEDSGNLAIPFADLLANDLKGPDNESNQTLTITAMNNVVGGTAVIQGSNIVFTPAANYHGPAGFVYTLRDNGTTNGVDDFKTSTATVTFNITEVNDPPVGGNDLLTSIAEDSAARTISIASLLANDSPGPSDESGQSLSLTAVSNPVGGTVAINGTNVVFTPTPDFNGLASFRYTVTDDGTTNGLADPQSTAVTVSFTITEKNDAPTGTDDSLASVAEDSGDRAISMASLLANDLKGPANEAGQTLTITGVSNAIGGTVQVFSTGTNVIFTPAADYNGPASFVYTLRDDGTTNGAPDFLTSTATVSFTITEVNDPPVGTNDSLSAIAEDSGDRTIVIADLLSNDIPGPANEAGQALTIVNVGSAIGGTVQISGANIIFTPTADYNGPASFVYTLRDDGTTGGVADPRTATATVSFTITEKNDAPTGVNDPLSSIAEDSGNRTIPIADLLSNDLKGPANESSQTLTIVSVGSPVGGTVQINGANIVFTPTADYNGPASFVYTLRDDGTTNGAPDFLTSTATVSFTITEKNDPPTGVDDFPPNFGEDSGPHSFVIADLLSNDLAGPSNESNQTLTIDTVGAAIGGTVQIVGSNVVFTPFADYNGPAGFQYTFHDDGTTNSVADPQSGSAKVSFTIFEVNDAPTAGNDSLPTTTEDFGPLPIFLTDLLANDSAGPANESTQTLTLFAVANVVGGTAQISGSQITFRPADDFFGTASFVYSVRDDGTTDGVLDAKTTTATVTFTVTEINDPPVGHDDSLASIPEDFGPRTIPFADLLGNDMKGPANESGQALTIIDVSSAVGGTVAINALDQTIIFTPTANYHGPASFIYTLQDNGTTNGAPDSKSGAAKVTFSITEVNDPPAGTDDTVKDIAEDSGPLTIPFTTLLGNDSPGPVNEADQSLTIIDVGAALGGTVHLDGTNVVFEPEADYFGAASFVYTLRDNGQTNGADDFKTATATVSFNITPVNDLPSFTFNGNGNLAAFDENPATHGPAAEQVVVNFVTNVVAGPPNESDQQLSIQMVVSNPSLFAVQPTIELSGTTGTLRYTPMPNAHGTANITLTLVDGAGGTAQGQFNLTINKLHKLHNAAETGKRNGLDVTGSTSVLPDGKIVAADVLAVINYINAKGSGPIPPNAPFGPPYCDVNGDDVVVAADALAIINYINSGAPSEGEAGAATPAMPDDYFVDLAAAESAAATPATASVAPSAALTDLIALLATDAAATQSKRRRVGG